MENSNSFSPTHTHTIALPHRWRVSTLNYVNMWFDHGEKKANSRKFENFPIPTQFPAHTSSERQQWQSNVSEEIKIMMEILERFRSDKTQERETTSAWGGPCRWVCNISTFSNVVFRSTTKPNMKATLNDLEKGKRKSEDGKYSENFCEFSRKCSLCVFIFHRCFVCASVICMNIIFQMRTLNTP